MTWLEMFRGVVEKDPHRIAATTDRGAVTYRELWDQAASSLAGTPRFGRRRLIVDLDPLTTLQQIIGAWQVGDVPTPILASLPPSLRDDLVARLKQPPPPQRSDDPGAAEGLILTTSGSTGVGKQVVLPLHAAALSAPALQPIFAQPEGTQMLVPTSLARAAGLFSSSLVALALGWTVHLFREGTPHSVLQKHIRDHGIHFIRGTPSTYRVYLSYWNGAPYPSVRVCAIGGEVPAPELLSRMQQAFPNARIFNGYAATETGTRVAMIASDEPGFGTGAIGKILPHFTWKLRPVEGVAAPLGELLLKGPGVFLGYLQPDGSYAGLTEDGYLATGDLMEAGTESCMFYHGRVDNLIKVGGHRVNPFTTETVIRALPAVNEVRCFATAHPLLGHVLVAEVETKPDHSITADDVLKACAGQVEPQQVPREVHIVAAIARTAAGKLPRFATT